MMASYVDIFITDNDITLDSGGEPLPIEDKPCIVQDIKHLIRDSGLLSQCIGERDQAKIQALLLRLQLMIEEDVRLVPGTIKLTRQTLDTFFVTATTVNWGVITFKAFA